MTPKTLILILLILSGFVLHTNMVHAESISFIQAQKKIALENEKSDPLLATETLLEIAKYYQSSDFDSVSVYASKASALATTHNLNDQVIRAWIIQTEIEYGDNIPKEVNCNKKYLNSEILKLVIGLKKSKTIKVDQNYLNKIDSILNYAIYVNEYKPDYNLAMLCYFRHKAYPKYLQSGITLKYLLFAKKIFKDLNKPVEELKTNGYIQIEYKRFKQNKEGIASINNSIEIAKKISIKEYIATGYVDLADFYTHSKNYYAANKNINKGLEIAKKYNLHEAEVLAYLKLQDNYFYLKKYELAIISGKKALLLMDTYQDYFHKLILLNIMSITYITMGNLDEAQKCLQEAKKEALEQENAAMKALTESNLGSLLLKKGDINTALKQFYSAKSFMLTQPEFYNKVELYDDFFQCYKALNKPDSVIKYLELKAVMKDSLQNQEAKNQLLELSVKYDADATATELSIIKANLERKEETLFTLIAIIALLIIIGILVVIYISLSRKSRRLFDSKQQAERESLTYKVQLQERQTKFEEVEKLRLQKENELKTRELTSLAAIVFENNKLVTELNTEISKIDFKVENNIEVQQTLTEMLNQQKYMDRQWDNFKTWFDQMNPNFFSTLQSKHEKLSANDLKILAYLKMGMSSQEIAVLQNIDHRSFFKSRQRLKEKLNLNTSEEIEQYLAKVS